MSRRGGNGGGAREWGARGGGRRGEPRSQGGANRFSARGGVQTGLGGAQIEGRQSVRELLRAQNRKVKEVLLGDSQAPAAIVDEIIDLCRENGVPIKEVSKANIAAIAQSDNPQGVVARTSVLAEVELDDLFATGADGTRPFIVAFDGITDPHNVGSLLRSAECAGVTGVIFPRHRSAHITPTVAKVAAGAIEYLPMTIVAGLASAISDAKAAGVWTVGMDMDSDTEISNLAVADQPVMIVMGAEGDGLSRLVRDRCDLIASIPQYGHLESLNVAAAGAISLFEVSRQRRQ